MTLKPNFRSASDAFDTIYGDGSLTHVAKVIGGKVKQNIEGGYFANACAIRMSYVLNRNGSPVSGEAGSMVSGQDHQRYFYRLRDMTSFLRRVWGTPDLELTTAASMSLKGRKGLLIFVVSGWSDASGHATLWDGDECSDRCYFDNATQVLFWELK